MIRVLVTDDSEVFRKLLGNLLERDPEIRVTGQASSGEEAVERVLRQPDAFDVVTMDVQMPGMGGLEATRRLMGTAPLPIVVVSACWSPEEIDLTFRAMDAGAVEILPKPRDGEPLESYAQELTAKVRRAASVRVLLPAPRHRAPKRLPSLRSEELQVVAVGASTGGPQALKVLLPRLPAAFPLPILLVQHITPGFEEGFVDWLGTLTPLPVRLARGGEGLSSPGILVAPAGAHLEADGTGRTVLSDAAPEHGVRPSVSVLFRSVARRYGNRGAAVLLSGMGRDGAEALGAIRQAGGTTFAQDEETSLIWGMPGEAVRLGTAEHVLPPEGIATVLSGMIDPKKTRKEEPQNSEVKQDGQYRDA